MIMMQEHRVSVLQLAVSVCEVPFRPSSRRGTTIVDVHNNREGLSHHKLDRKLLTAQLQLEAGYFMQVQNSLVSGSLWTGP